MQYQFVKCQEKKLKLKKKKKIQIGALYFIQINAWYMIDWIQWDAENFPLKQQHLRYNSGHLDLLFLMARA